MVMEAIRCLDLLVRVASLQQLAAVLSEVLPRAEGEGEEPDDDDPMLTLQPQGEQTPAETVHARLPHFEALARKLISAEFYREAEALTAITWTVAATLPPPLAAAHSKWAMHVCTHHPIEHQGLVKNLLGIALHLQLHPHDLTTSLAVLNELEAAIGEDDEAEAAQTSESIRVVGSKTQRAVTTAVLRHTEVAVEEVSWLITSMRSGTVSHACSTSRSQLETAAFARTEMIAKVVDRMVKVVPPGPTEEAALKLIVHLYQVLTAATRGCIAPKGVKQAPVCRAFHSLVGTVSQTLTPGMYEFLCNMQTEVADAKGKTSAAKVKREGRHVPNLVFHVEEFEKYLIQLGSATGVNLMRGAKRSMARDFRLTALDEEEAPGTSGGKRNAPSPETSEASEAGDEDPDEHTRHSLGSTQDEGEEEPSAADSDLSV